jgi:hypothetical protein
LRRDANAAIDGARRYKNVPFVRVAFFEHWGVWFVRCGFDGRLVLVRCTTPPP